MKIYCFFWLRARSIPWLMFLPSNRLGKAFFILCLLMVVQANASSSKTGRSGGRLGGGFKKSTPRAETETTAGASVAGAAPHAAVGAAPAAVGAAPAAVTEVHHHHHGGGGGFGLSIGIPIPIPFMGWGSPAPLMPAPVPMMPMQPGYMPMQPGMPMQQQPPEQHTMTTTTTTTTTTESSPGEKESK